MLETEPGHCAICIQELNKYREMVCINMYTKCVHIYHEHCIIQWIAACIGRQQTPTCPMCRELWGKYTMLENQAW